MFSCLTLPLWKQANVGSYPLSFQAINSISINPQYVGEGGKVLPNTLIKQ